MTTENNPPSATRERFLSSLFSVGPTVMATAAYPWQGKVVHIPAVHSDTSGVSWITRTTTSNTRTVSSSRPQCSTQQEMMMAGAVAVIESWWWRTKNRRVFRILKETIRAAERSLTNDVIRKVCPGEAELLKDPTMKAKIKFRFGGERFPPVIMFKIFISGVAMGVQYFSGKKMIRPASEAARDAQRSMGSRLFYDQMLVDVCQQHQLKVTDEIDITTMKEYMQYVSTVDETPAYLGGKENTWRKLNLKALPRHSVMYSVIELLEQHSLAASSGGGLSLEKLRSFTRPPTQLDQIQQIKTISSLRTGEGERSMSRGSRGSRIARRRARKMRATYTTTTSAPSTPHHSQSGRESDGEETGESDIEKEASELYEWTQNLSFDDVK